MTPANEHVGEIERDSHDEEENKVYYRDFSFQTIPTMVLIYTVYSVTLWLNVFGTRSGITGGFLPRELLTGLTLIILKHCCFGVEDFVEANTDVTITNINSDKTHSCIYLVTPENRQYFHNCSSLDMGRVFVQRLVNQMLSCNRLLNVANTRGGKDKHCRF